MKGEGELEVEGVESPLCAKPHKSHAVRSCRKIWKIFEKSKFSKSIRFTDMISSRDTSKNPKQ